MVLQFIVVPVHIFRSFMRSWMSTGILKVSANRAQAPAALVQSVVQQLEMEQENWDVEIIDDGVV